MVAGAEVLDVRFRYGEVSLLAHLALPAAATRLIVLVPDPEGLLGNAREDQVRRALEARGFATVAIRPSTSTTDGTTRDTLRLRSNVETVARQVIAAIDWVRRQPQLEHLSLGLFSVGPGAASALVAAAARPHAVGAVVAIDGDPDPAGDVLPLVLTPILMLVASGDPAAIDRSRRAAAAVPVVTDVELVDEATHILREPGALNRALVRAIEWYDEWLGSGRGRSPFHDGRPGNAAGHA